MPQPVVERRFKDAQPVARMASELVERNLSYMGDEADIDSIMRAVRDDFLLCARGTVWLRYEADFEPLDMGVQPSDAPVNGGLPEGLPSGLPAGSRRIQRLEQTALTFCFYGHQSPTKELSDMDMEDLNEAGNGSEDFGAFDEKPVSIRDSLKAAIDTAEGNGPGDIAGQPRDGENGRFLAKGQEQAAAAARARAWPASSRCNTWAPT
ncbi:hypothetical protein ACVIKO_003039 [Rhizobium ruizarguesonis]